VFSEDESLNFILNNLVIIIKYFYFEKQKEIGAISKIIYASN